MRSLMCSSVRVCCGMKIGAIDLRKRWISGLSFMLELIGLILTLNLSLLESLSLCDIATNLSMDAGWSDRGERRWWKLDVPCSKCQRHVTYQSGITCANFGETRGYSQPCRSAWCAECFVPHSLDTFETAVPRDFNGASLSEVEDEIRFRQARPGDHLCTPFQCPECQSRNIRGMGLTVGNAADDTFEFLCRRATLDAFWRHSSSTVRRHVAEVRFIIRYCDLLQIAAPFPPLGPYPRGFHGGMFHAMMVVRRSLELGRNGRVKFGTARHVRSTLTVLWECSPLGGGDATFSSNSKSGRFIITRNPSESRWFQYFIHGCRARMG